MRALTQLVCALVSLLPLTEAAVPGKFFWKPRAELIIAQHAELQLAQSSHVVVIDGYQMGLTIAALASYLQNVRAFSPHLHPGMAPYYTNMYRWAIRHLSLLPEWLSHMRTNYVTTHEVWNKRFFYMNQFVPQWMRKILFFVKDESWNNEEWEWKKFEKHAEPHFSKFYHYPSKKFDNFRSMQHPNTIENIDASVNSIGH